jgi:3-oxoadipate enol-lactonase
MFVLLHGVGGRASMWDAVVEQLRGLGHEALALDLPGYGANSQRLEPYDFASLSAWLGQRLQALGSPVCLVGQSFGGMIALDYAARAQASGTLPALRQLVLMNTTPAFGKPGGDWQQQFVNSRLAPLRAGKSMLEVGQAIAPGMMGSQAPAHCLPEALAMMGAVSSQTYELAVRCLSSFDRRASLPILALPVLCLAGQEDVTAPAHVMEKMASLLPRSKFEAIPFGGHLLPLEYPAHCARSLAHFYSHNGVFT